MIFLKYFPEKLEGVNCKSDKNFMKCLETQIYSKLKFKGRGSGVVATSRVWSFDEGVDGLAAGGYLQGLEF
jgi:hypothetical protein